jgi:hypothetical protein
VKGEKRYFNRREANIMGILKSIRNALFGKSNVDDYDRIEVDTTYYDDWYDDDDDDGDDNVYEGFLNDYYDRDD